MPKKTRIQWLGIPKYPSVEAVIAMPPAIYYLLKFRPDLMQLDNESLAARVALFCWWENGGYQDYPQLEWKLNQRDISFLKKFSPADFIEQYPDAVHFWLRSNEASLNAHFDLINSEYLVATHSSQLNAACSLPILLQVIWTFRSDLQQLFDISTTYGCLSFFAWWTKIGQKEYPRIKWHPEKENLANLFVANWPQAGESLVFPAFIGVLWESRGDLRSQFKIETEYGCLQLLNWWHKAGQSEYAFINWSSGNTPELHSYLQRIDENTASIHKIIPNFLRIIWEARGDLRSQFKIETEYGCLQLLNWWEQSGRLEYPALFISNFHQTKNDNKASWPQTDMAANTFSETSGIQRSLSTKMAVNSEPTPSDIDFLSVSIRPAIRTKIIEPPHSFGLNIIGFAQGILGLGEDVRMAATACQQAEIPISVIDAPIPGPVKADYTLDKFLVKDLRHHISLFCLPPAEMIRLAIEGGAELINSNAYNIGAWPWELPHWPTSFTQVHEFVDEIWAQSRFVSSVFQRITDKPVIQMPIAVEIPAPLNYSRDRFSFPKSDFLFFLLFDGCSWLSRKNPLAGVQAFVKAFPFNTSGVGLVIKAMNVNNTDPQWQAILSLIANDPRVIIINEKMPRQGLIDLMACCDAYISLHRSEGFGRVIAEAMLLGKPTIATNFSGNVDFCNSSTSYLVDGDLVPLQREDYLFYEGQYWCDPDVNLASEKMLQLFEDKLRREIIALAGQRYIEEHHSINAVARAYTIRLDQIKNKLERAT